MFVCIVFIIRAWSSYEPRLTTLLNEHVSLTHVMKSRCQLNHNSHHVLQTVHRLIVTTTVIVASLIPFFDTRAHSLEKVLKRLKNPSASFVWLSNQSQRYLRNRGREEPNNQKYAPYVSALYSCTFELNRCTWNRGPYISTFHYANLTYDSWLQTLL